MSDFFSLNYFCEWSRKTSKHVMIYYVKHLKICKKLKINEQINLKKIMIFFKKIKNHNIMIEIEFVFSILINSRIKKTWFVN